MSEKQVDRTAKIIFEGLKSEPAAVIRAILKKGGYTDILVAVGAWKPGRSALQYGEALDALDFGLCEVTVASVESDEQEKHVLTVRIRY